MPPSGGKEIWGHHLVRNLRARTTKINKIPLGLLCEFLDHFSNMIPIKKWNGLDNTKPLILAGEYILCPKCGQRLYRLRQALRYGEKIMAGNFEPVGENPSLVMNEVGASKCCLQMWLNNGSLFTSRGWVPHNPF